MKKTLLSILVLGAFTLLPIKPLAMLEVDENGNPIKQEVSGNEVTTLMAPDETVSSDDGQTGNSSQSTEPSKAIDGIQSTEPSKAIDGIQSTEPSKAIDGVLYNTTATDDVLYTTTGVEEDEYKTVSTEESAELFATANKNDSIAPIVLSGGIGSLLGILGTVLVLSRRK